MYFIISSITTRTNKAKTKSILIHITPLCAFCHRTWERNSRRRSKYQGHIGFSLSPEKLYHRFFIIASIDSHIADCSKFVEIGVSVLKAKIKIPQNQRFHGIFDGRSDWIRTSGHLNPIQVLYQTEPHPETSLCPSLITKSASRFCSSLRNSSLFPKSALRWRFSGGAFLRQFHIIAYVKSKIKTFFEKS